MYEAHRERVRSNPNLPKNKYKNRASKYGLSVEELQVLQNKNDGICPICTVRPAFAVDHCHETGQVRGYLCSSCNLGLGKFGDSVEGLERAIRYLKGEI